MAMVLLYIITDSWNHSGHYGLHTCFPSSSIHLASSLTIKTISKNNGGGGKITVVPVQLKQLRTTKKEQNNKYNKKNNTCEYNTSTANA